MRLDIMTDIETLGIQPDSTIIQISAIAFNINTGEKIFYFNETADIEKNKSLKVNGETLKWWVKTDKELLDQLLNTGKKSSEDALKNFYDWLQDLRNSKSYDLYLWGNGILFDNNMIQSQLNSLSLDYPIYYKNDRDVRTIVDLASKKVNLTEKELKALFHIDGLKAHDALDDCRNQVALVQGCYNILINSNSE